MVRPLFRPRVKGARHGEKRGGGGEGEGVFRQEVYYYNAQNCSVRYESAGVIDGDAHCESVYNSVKPDVNLNPVCRNKDVYFKLRK